VNRSYQAQNLVWLAVVNQLVVSGHGTTDNETCYWILMLIMNVH